MIYSNEIISPSVFLEVSKRIKRYTDIEKMLIEKSFKLIAERPDAMRRRGSGKRHPLRPPSAGCLQE